MPDIRTNKLEWFNRFDEDLSGELSVSEVTRGLIKSFHLSSHVEQVRALRDIVANIWCVFDEDQSGEVSREEFLRPGDGMADSIIASFNYH